MLTLKQRSDVFDDDFEGQLPQHFKRVGGCVGVLWVSTKFSEIL